MRITTNPFSKLRNRLKAGQLKPQELDFPLDQKAPPLDIRVCDSVLYQNGKESVVLYAKARNKSLYRVRLWLDGADLPLLAGVCYRFPAASGLPELALERRMDNVRCEAFIWAGALIELAAGLTLKDGRAYILRHTLSIDRELKSPRTTLIEVAATGAGAG